MSESLQDKVILSQLDAYTIDKILGPFVLGNHAALTIVYSALTVLTGVVKAALAD